MSEPRRKAVKCYSSALDRMKGPEGFQTSPAFTVLRWSIAGEQRNEQIRLFGRRLLARLDAMGLPFYVKAGLMDLRMAQHRYVTGVDPWSPIESPFLDGIAIELAHCIEPELPQQCWNLLAEIGFDVGKLSQTPVLWGGFADVNRPGMWLYRWADIVPCGWQQDGRTYGSRIRNRIDFDGV